MAKLSQKKLKTLATLMLVVIGVFIVINHFVLEPRKKKAEYAKMQQQAEDRQPQQGKCVTPVKVIDVVRHDYVDVLEALGNIKGGVESKLTFSIPGTISAINYREGEKYQKGSLLMSLDEEDILLRMKRVEAGMNKAQTTVEMAKQKLEEHKTLYKIGAIPKTTLDKVMLELESSIYDLEAAQLEVQANEAVLGKANMYAISDGMIGELYVEAGETITANTLIGTHILIEYVRAEFGVVERDMQKIKTGQTTDVYVDTYQNQKFTGIVDSIGAVVGGSSRTATVSVKLDNSEGLLLPGMFARIRVDLYKKKNALVLPTEALIKDDAGDTFVFVLDTETHTVHKTKVTIAYSRSDYSEIGTGLTEGQTIVMTSLDSLEDESQVEVVEKQTLEFE